MISRFLPDSAGLRIALFFLLFVVAVGCLEMLMSQSPDRVNLDDVLAAPSWQHWLGADSLGRDVLARLSHGVRLSLMIAAIVVMLSALIGITIGLIAGSVGGYVDDLLMRITDIFLAFPGILLAIALAAVLGPGVENLLMALVAVGWVGFARLARASVLSIKHVEYIQAAHISGTTPSFTLLRHVLPNISAPLIVEATFSFAAVIIGEAGLSFLGVGVQPPEASLGNMIREGTRMMLSVPSLVVWPGLVLFMIVMSVNLLGDGLRDYLDVKGHGHD